MKRSKQKKNKKNKNESNRTLGQYWENIDWAIFEKLSRKRNFRYSIYMCCLMGSFHFFQKEPMVLETDILVPGRKKQHLKMNLAKRFSI